MNEERRVIMVLLKFVRDRVCTVEQAMQILDGEEVEIPLGAGTIALISRKSIVSDFGAYTQ